jgi:hypothetical protein
MNGYEIARLAADRAHGRMMAMRQAERVFGPSVHCRERIDHPRLELLQMSKTLRLLVAVALGLAATLSAPAQTVPYLLAPQVPFSNGGGGTVTSTGFLTAVTSTPVSMQNLIPGSYDLSSASGFWTLNASSGLTPTSVNVSGVTLPEGSTGTVTSLTIPHVSAAGPSFTPATSTTTPPSPARSPRLCPQGTCP